MPKKAQFHSVADANAAPLKAEMLCADSPAAVLALIRRAFADARVAA